MSHEIQQGQRNKSALCTGRSQGGPPADRETAARLVRGLARDRPHPEERREIAALHGHRAFEQLSEGLLVSAAGPHGKQPSPPPPNGSTWWRETDLVGQPRSVGCWIN